MLSGSKKKKSLLFSITCHFCAKNFCVKNLFFATVNSAWNNPPSFRGAWGVGSLVQAQRAMLKERYIRSALLSVVFTQVNLQKITTLVFFFFFMFIQCAESQGGRLRPIILARRTTDDGPLGPRTEPDCSNNYPPAPAHCINITNNNVFLFFYMIFIRIGLHLFIYLDHLHKFHLHHEF